MRRLVYTDVCLWCVMLLFFSPVYDRYFVMLDSVNNSHISLFFCVMSFLSLQYLFGYFLYTLCSLSLYEAA